MSGTVDRLQRELEEKIISAAWLQLVSQCELQMSGVEGFRLQGSGLG